MTSRDASSLITPIPVAVVWVFPRGTCYALEHVLFRVISLFFFLSSTSNCFSSWFSGSSSNHCHASRTRESFDLIYLLRLLVMFTSFPSKASSLLFGVAEVNLHSCLSLKKIFDVVAEDKNQRSSNASLSPTDTRPMDHFPCLTMHESDQESRGLEAHSMAVLNRFRSDTKIGV